MTSKEKALENFTIVRGKRKSNVTQKELNRMNRKYGGWWPKVMEVKK